MSPDISERSFEEASTLRVVPRARLCGDPAWQPVRVPRRDVVACLTNPPTISPEPGCVRRSTPASTWATLGTGIP